MENIANIQLKLENNLSQMDITRQAEEQRMANLMNENEELKGKFIIFIHNLF